MLKKKQNMCLSSKTSIIITHNVLDFNVNVHFVIVGYFKWQMSHFGMKQLRFTVTETHQRAVKTEIKTP